MKQVGILLIVVALIAFVFSGVFSPDRSIFPVVNWVKGFFNNTSEQIRDYEESFSNTYDTNIENISIEVVSSNVYILKDDSTSNIKVTYEGNGELRVSEGSTTLTLEEKFKKWNLGNIRKGNLEIIVPANLEDLEISSASGDIEIKDISGNTLNLDNVSGKILLDNISYEKIDIESISGNITIDNMGFDEGNFNNVSGSINANIIKVWDEFSIETISGDIELSLAKEISPNITFESVSGKLNSSISSTESNNCDLEINTVSGDVSVETN